ncbi:hypothetical protein ILYODFUR_013233 [Ilyodon furcidens]|uniref:Uncharacterized protein n=1 Tax=Ilyodon furcidens TaxID=33524 RepID=A0ABV0V2N9_9TELE
MLHMFLISPSLTSYWHNIMGKINNTLNSNVVAVFALRMHKATVGSTVALQQEGRGFKSQPGLSTGSLHVLPGLSGYFAFIPQSKSMTVRLISPSELFVLCCPMLNWRPVQGVPFKKPYCRWR